MIIVYLDRTTPLDNNTIEEGILQDAIYSEASWALVASVKVGITEPHRLPALIVDPLFSRQTFIINPEVMRQYYCLELLIDRNYSKQATIA